MYTITTHIYNKKRNLTILGVLAPCNNCKAKSARERVSRQARYQKANFERHSDGNEWIQEETNIASNAKGQVALIFVRVKISLPEVRYERGSKPTDKLTSAATISS